MPVFTCLVIIGVITLWFLLTWLFKPLGKFFHRLGKDAYDVMTEEDEETKE